MPRRGQEATVTRPQVGVEVGESIASHASPTVIEDKVVDRLGEWIPEVDGEIHRWCPNAAALPAGHRWRPGSSECSEDQMVDGCCVVGSKPPDGFGRRVVVLMGTTRAKRMS